MPAYREASEMLRLIGHHLLNSDDLAKRATGSTFQHAYLDPAAAAVSGVSNAINTHASSDVLQDQAGEFYRRYQALVTWIHQGGDLIGNTFAPDCRPFTAMYDDWEREHKYFLDRVRQAITRTELAAFAQHVNGVGWGVRP
jgi:hypothetical protein